MMTTTRPQPAAGPVGVLPALAGLLSALLLVMLGLGIAVALGHQGFRGVHSAVGYAAMAIAVVAAAVAFRQARATGRMGTFWHALSIPAMMLAQIALGEMGIETIHMVLGVAILVAAIGLVTMSGRASRRVDAA